METIQGLGTKFNKDTETLKKTKWNEELKTQLENSRHSLTSRMDQAEDRTLGLEDKADNPEQISMEYKKKKNHSKGKKGKEHAWNVIHYEKKTFEL